MPEFTKSGTFKRDAEDDAATISLRASISFAELLKPRLFKERRASLLY